MIFISENHYHYWHVRWARHHSMARPRAANGGTASSYGGWMEGAVNISNKQPQTNDKGWSSSWGVGCGTNNPSQ
jgi:hypothetical protein